MLCTEMKSSIYTLVTTKITGLYQVHKHTHCWHPLSVKAMSLTVFLAADYISLCRLKGGISFQDKLAHQEPQRKSAAVIISPPNMPRQQRGVLHFPFTASKLQTLLYCINCEKDGKV